MKEKYDVGMAVCDFATITENSFNRYNPYEVEMKICFADYESAIKFISCCGFSTDFKKIIEK